MVKEKDYDELCILKILFSSDFEYFTLKNTRAKKVEHLMDTTSHLNCSENKCKYKVHYY